MLDSLQAKTALQKLFRRTPVVELRALYQALQTRSRMSVFRRMKEVGYLSSYTHTCRFYTLRSIPEFDAFGLWHYRDVGFSRAGTLKASVVDLVDSSSAGRTPRELHEILRVRVNNALLDLARACKIRRESSSEERSLYVSVDGERACEQLARRLDVSASEGRPPSDLVIEVLLELLDAATVDATPAEVARRLVARGVGATAAQVRQVFERYKLGRKKGVRSPRSRR
ncbi:MAG: hypothetical protein AUJ52_01275 [Elusimicrobia bacterium CG1_02_63_36]|nr:MAG: hypothetical protein AUJ52_01275 [Elusimicrobia bacterium CG1_02_63_36]PIP82537.1 MAG: hypothetical protein COR54_14365 [Elusimicrobia bacterium CG22_combo_CG10-13_8_21_14_all_63_91]PJA14503.1 MAG: hypothetical protein COX66_12400 [Elusimicrobia bacterium CG_4_10_14_0_2_um_filter_63_34]PJB26360.1 MAG: hypothetical protein CO113_04105 [Elusimicrobia bacterium CG_4_9_14_3_um_filter_62_55]